MSKRRKKKELNSYVAIVAAESGLLLGGVRQTRSFPFESLDDAVRSGKATVEANVAAGRKAVFVAIKHVHHPNPIKHSEIAG